jgi:hypothetical protein
MPQRFFNTFRLSAYFRMGPTRPPLPPLQLHASQLLLQQQQRW